MYAYEHTSYIIFMNASARSEVHLNGCRRREYWNVTALPNFDELKIRKHRFRVYTPIYTAL